jgi:UDP-2,3-diacylglucosamine hydrolase
VRVLAGPCWIFSDTHLGAAPDGVESRVVDFLRDATRTARSIIINCDLFDFWFEWRTVIPRSSFRVLAAISDAKAAGVEVTWIAGNHDCWGGDVLRDDVGVTYHTGPWHGEIAGWKTLIEHGDGLRKREDRRYRALRSILRNRLSIRAYRWLHPDIGTWLALRSSHASRVTRARDGGAGLRGVAMEQLASDPSLDLVVYGHSHVATLERAAGGGAYANAGAWVVDSTYIEVREDTVALRRWRDSSAESECLDVIHRRSEKALS